MIIIKLILFILSRLGRMKDKKRQCLRLASEPWMRQQVNPEWDKQFFHPQQENNLRENDWQRERCQQVLYFNKYFSCLLSQQPREGYCERKWIFNKWHIALDNRSTPVKHFLPCCHCWVLHNYQLLPYRMQTVAAVLFLLRFK